MKKIIWVILGILALATGLLLSSPAHCWWCLWSGPCYSSRICGSHCVCIKMDPLDFSGRCVVVER